MKRPLLAMLTVLAATGARADALSKDEFAFGIELEPATGASIHRYTLPEQVLRTVTDDALGDLCVLDAEGGQLAHALELSPIHEPEASLLPVPYFPLEEASERARGVEVHVERDPRGAITRAYSQPLTEPFSRLTGYLLDTSALTLPLSALRVSLSESRDFMVELSVEASDDLTHFRAVSSATLVYRAYQGQTLRQDRVALPSLRARYLRLSLRGDGRDQPVQSIEVEIRRESTERPHGELTLEGKAVADKGGQTFAYTLPGPFRVESYGVVLPASTPLVEATLLSGAEREGPFQVVGSGVAHTPVVMEPVRALAGRHLELRIADKGGGIRTGTPQLRLGYLPPTLRFLGTGEPPYLLVYGSGRARCKPFDVAQLDSLGSSPGPVRPSGDSVRALRTLTLSGAAALTKEEPPRPVRVYVLWSVLVIAVIVLALAARKLVRQV